MCSSYGGGGGNDDSPISVSEKYALLEYPEESMGGLKVKTG